MAPRTPPLDTLLAHRAFVRGLAHALVRDPSEAEDIEQETWLAALRKPPHGANPRAWLGSVVRRQAARRGRREARLRQRAEHAPGAAAPREPGDVLERAETTQRAIRAVLALEDPYRTTLLLRFHEDHSIAEVAHAMGVPVETARTRLRRGLARVRHDLDTEHGERKRWALLLAPPGSLPFTAAAPVTTITGGWMTYQGSRALLAAALLLLIVGGVWVFLADPFEWRGVEPQSDEGLASDGVTLPGATLEGRLGASAGKPETPIPSQDEAPTPPPGVPSLRLRLLDSATRAPIHDAWIWVAIGTDEQPGRLGTTQTARSPVFHAWPWKTQPAVVWVQTKNRTARFAFDALAAGERDLLLEPAAYLEVTFLDEAGRARTPSEVREMLDGQPPKVSLVPIERLTLNPLVESLATTLAYRSAAQLEVVDGAYRVTPVPTKGSWVLFMEIPGRTPWLSGAVTLAAGKTAPLQIDLPDAGATHPFRYVDAETKAPIAHTYITPHLEWGDDQAFLLGTALRTDENGLVRLPVHTLQGRMRGRGPSWWLENRHHAYLQRSSRFPDPGPEGWVTVDVPRTGALEGMAYGTDGRPAVGQTVMVRRKGKTWNTVVDAKGRYRLEGLPPKGTRVILVDDLASMRGQMARAQVVSGETTTLNLGEPFEVGSRGRFVFEASEGRRRYQSLYVILRPRGKGAAPAIQTTDRDGRAAFNGLKPGVYDLAVYLGNGQAGDDFTYTTRRDGPGIVIEPGASVTESLKLPGGRLPIHVVDATSGKPVVGAVLFVHGVEAERTNQGAFALRSGAAEFTSPVGRALLRGLPLDGALRVRARAAGYEPWERDDVFLLPDEEVLEVRLTPTQR